MSLTPPAPSAQPAVLHAMPSRWHAWRPHLPALFFCAVFVTAFFLDDAVAGLLLFLCVAPALALWVILNAVFIATRPAQRRCRAINLALVAAVVIGTVSVDEAITQSHRDAARRDADQALAQVQAFQARTGAWPGSLAEAGVDALLIEAHGMQLWRGTDGCLGLIYRDKYDERAFSSSWYEYDCQSKSWQQVWD